MVEKKRAIVLFSSKREIEDQTCESVSERGGWIPVRLNQKPYT